MPPSVIWFPTTGKRRYGNNIDEGGCNGAHLEYHGDTRDTMKPSHVKSEPTSPAEEPRERPRGADGYRQRLEGNRLSNQQFKMEEMPPQAADFEVYEDEPGLREFVGFILRNWLSILAVALLVFLAGLSYAFMATPIYKTDALVQIEDRQSKSKDLSDLTAMLTGGEVTTEAEIEILRSRFVVGRIVDDLRLDTAAYPVRFPVIGSFAARRYEGEGPAPPFLGLESYAWGGEAIQMESLEVPDHLLGFPLTLIAGAEGSFKLFDPDDRLLLEGRVGEPATGSGVRLLLGRLEARPGTHFSLVRQCSDDTIAGIQTALQVSEKGKNTGILSVALEGANGQRAADIINALVANYQRQNVQRRSEENQKMLDFLNAQAPRIQTELQNVETALGDYRSKTGTLGLSLEAQSFVSASAEIEQQAAMLRLQKAEFEQRFTGNHPALAAINKKLAQLGTEKQKLAGQIKHIPETELQAVRLERDSRVASEIYVMLLNKVQELSVAKAGTIGNVRIVDPARRPRHPVKPKKGIVALASLVAGLMLGLGFAYVRRSLLKGVEDPEEIERKLGLPVYCAIPHTRKQKAADKARRGRGHGHGTSERFLLAEKHPQDLSIESIRSLRTSLQFALMDSDKNVIVITGPSFGVGKSFVSANLAATLAEAGKKTVLVDADMRKGHLHTSLGFKRSPGLSNLITGEISVEQCVHPDIFSGLDFIASGTVPPNPSELLVSDRFRELILELSSRYDIVLMDTPPVLAVTDAGIVGRSAGACFMVLGHGQHQVREIELAHKRLIQAGVRVQGVVFNNIPMGGMGYSYGKYYGYHYQYTYK